MAKSKVSFSIALLKMNRKHHIRSVEQYTFSKKHRASWAKETAKACDKRLRYHQGILDDLNLAIKKLSSIRKVKKAKSVKGKK